MLQSADTEHFSHWRVLFWTVLFSMSFPLPEENEVERSEQKWIKAFKKDLWIFFSACFFFSLPHAFFFPPHSCKIQLSKKANQNSVYLQPLVITGNIFSFALVVFSSVPINTQWKCCHGREHLLGSLIISSRLHDLIYSSVLLFSANK